MRTNFKFEDDNITMIKGDTMCFNCQLFDMNGNAMSVDEAKFICADSSRATSFSVTLGSGITQSDGVLTVRLAPSRTSNKEAGQYYYQFWVKLGSDVWTIKKGLLTLEESV